MKNAFRKRFDFSKIPATIQIPNLIEVQKRSYDRFLQMDKLPSEREDGGLQAVFQSVFPITDFRNVSQLEFVDYAIGNWECKCGHLKGLHHLRTTCKNCGNTVITDPFHPGEVLCGKCGTYNANTPDFCNKCGDPVGLQLKYDVAECEERGMTYSAPLKVTMRLTIFDKDAETGNRSIRDIKEQEVFFGDVPLMTQNGTFIINGTERVIVSQLHRSPGVFFETANNRTYFLGKIIPYRGSWVEFEYDQKNVLYVRIDRKRKFLGTIFLRALGLRSGEDILKTFFWSYSNSTTSPAVGNDLAEEVGAAIGGSKDHPANGATGSMTRSVPGVMKVPFCVIDGSVAAEENSCFFKSPGGAAGSASLSKMVQTHGDRAARSRSSTLLALSHVVLQSAAQPGRRTCFRKCGRVGVVGAPHLPQSASTGMERVGDSVGVAATTSRVGAEVV